MPDPIVFIPGLNCTGALFRQQAEALGAEHPIEIADTTKDESIAAMAARLLANAPPHFALAGLSMGGYVALEVMRMAPRRVTRLALLDTSARPDTTEATSRRIGLIRKAEQGEFAQIHPALWPMLVAPDRRADAELEQIVRAMTDETGPVAFIAQERAIIGRMDSRPFLSTITVPTLILVGADDQLTPPELAREMADAIPGAELVVIEGAGHLSTLERPAEVTAALRAWLDRPGHTDAQRVQT
jgi:pimeloyl-ACP methyl ester carboxylesterase